jgi:opacity protein-like surface antigen
MPNNAYIPPENKVAEYEDGYSVGAGAGIDFGNWRMGMELSHRSYDNSEPGKGHAELNAMMINGGWEIGFWDSNVFYLGASLGPSLVKIQRPAPAKPLRSYNFAYQLSTGLGHRFTESLSGRFGYKYFSTASADDFDPHGSHALEAVLEIDL